MKKLYQFLYKTNFGGVILGLFMVLLCIAVIISIAPIFAKITNEKVIEMLTFLIVVPIAMSITFAPVIVTFLKLKAMPEQKARVRVAEKNQYLISPGQGPYTRYYLTFEFPDGSRKSFRVKSLELLNTTVENDMGTLTYKEYGGEKMFISFVRDIQLYY